MKFTNKLAKFINSNDYSLESLVIIVPNERAIKFIYKSLYEEYGKPIFSPKIISIDAWIRSVCPYSILDKTRLLIELYRIQESNPIEQGELSFDQFMGWGQTLLQDFDEINRYLLDHSEVFRNLKDIRELESWNMDIEELSITQQKFMAFWEKLPDYYQRLNEKLLSKNRTYSGRAYRWVADNIALLDHSNDNQKIQYLFAGFNALSKSEMEIIKYLKNFNNAEILIDADSYYLSENIHEAGAFLRKLLQELDVKELDFTENHLTTSSKEITLIDCAQYTGQVKVAATELSKLSKEQLNDTLVLLADEALIVPMLRNIPKSVEKANITLGLPLKFTPVKTWIDLIFRIQENKKRFGEEVIYFGDLEQFLNHPFVQSSSDKNEKKQMSELEQNSKKYNRIVQRIDNLELSERIVSLLNLISASWSDQWSLGIKNIRNANQAIFETLSDKHLFERAVVQHFDSSLIEIENISHEGLPPMNLKSFGLLFKNHAFKKSIAYHGNPVDGLQIMGLLETRLLDFERILILGMNEGNLPPTNIIDTFIPMDLRKYLGLPLPRDKQGLFAHHFYRLLHQSKQLFITYSSTGESIGGAEPSRYIIQLEMELERHNKNISIKKQNYHIPEDESVEMTDQIVKDEFYFKRLDEFLNKALSASALNKFMKCPKDFYYRYLLEFGEEESLEEEIESNTFGTFIHAVLEQLYTPFALFDKNGKPLRAEKIILKVEDINSMLEQFEALMFEQFMKHFGNNKKAFETGKNLLSYKMSLELTKKILEKEKQEIEQGVERYIYQLESYLTTEIEVEIGTEKRKILLHGYVDRIDGENDKMRVIDYKSGYVKSDHVLFKLDENGDVKKSFLATKHALQLAIYGLLFEKKFGFLPHDTAVYSLVNIQEGLFKLNSESLTLKEIVDLLPKLLQQVITELYDTEERIEHNSDSKYCQFC
jgi:CRISPR/Cas system-associated exonuclease Cas4 (RecB family)